MHTTWFGHGPNELPNQKVMNQGGHIERSKRFSLGIRTVMMLRPLFCPEGSYEADSETSSNKKNIQRNVEALEFSCWPCLPCHPTRSDHQILSHLSQHFLGLSVQGAIQAIQSYRYPWLLVALMTPSMGHLRASQPYVTGCFSNFACKALGFQQLFILVTWTAKLFMWKADKSMLCETLDFIVGCQHLCCPWSHSKKCLEGASGASCEASSFTRTCHIVHQLYKDPSENIGKPGPEPFQLDVKDQNQIAAPSRLYK